MPWISITEADVLTVLSGPELSGYRAAAIADAQIDPVQPAIDAVTDLVRGYVAGCQRNVLGPAGTIPSKLRVTALDLISIRIPQRVGKTPKRVRDDAEKNAIKLLEQVAACKFAVEEPAPGTADTEPISGPSPSFCGRPRREVRRERNGL